MRRLILIAAALATISCSKDIQNPDAVKQGVLDYLRAKNSQTGLNMDAMQVDVTSVSFQRDEARATLRFTPKGIPGGGMQMSYSLDRKGSKWVVRGRTESGANPHGAGAVPAQPGDLPLGHPAIGSPNPSGSKQ